MRLKVFIPLLLAFLFVVGFLVWHNYKDTPKEEPIVESITSQGVKSWLEYFSLRDFKSCDSLLENANDGLYNSKIYHYVVDERYYTMLLDSLVNCIDTITTEPIEGNVGEYKVIVTFKPYSKTDALEYSLDMFESTKSSFVSEKITETEFQEKLNELYWGIYCDSCFNVNEDIENKTIEFILSEKDKYDRSFVYGTVEFVNILLEESNLLENIAFYEENIKEVVTLILDYE